MIINTKTKMYKYLYNNLFGNTSKIYKKIFDIPDNKFVSMRYNQTGNMKKCNPKITKKEILKLSKSNISFSDITVFERPENKANCVLNAEKTRNYYGLELTYKIGNMWMRPALKNFDRAIGLKAKIILEQYLNFSDYDCVMDLLDLYPDHIIEFTVFDSCIGNISNRNTIIWEVRKY